jgi:hypothetical protein
MTMHGGIRLAAIIGVVLLVVGCGGGSDDVREIIEKIGQPPPPVGEITEEPPTLTPLVDERPLWDGTGLPGGRWHGSADSPLVARTTHARSLHASNQGAQTMAW